MTTEARRRWMLALVYALHGLWCFGLWGIVWLVTHMLDGVYGPFWLANPRGNVAAVVMKWGTVVGAIVTVGLAAAHLRYLLKKYQGKRVDSELDLRRAVRSGGHR